MRAIDRIRARRTRSGGMAAFVVTCCLAVGVIGAIGAIGATGVAAAAPGKKPSPTTTTTKKSKKSTKQAKVVDPCVLVSQSQAETLIAMKLLAPTKSGNPTSGFMCQYNADPNGPVGSVQISTGAGVKKALDIDKDNLHHDFTQLTGVGDEAWLENGSVFVRKGTQWVQVYVVSLDTPPEQIQSGLQSLAGTIARSL